MNTVTDHLKIDSTSIRIPLKEETQIVSDELGKEYIDFRTYTDTGETIEGEKKTLNKIYIEQEGIKHEYSIQVQPDLNNKKRPHIVIGVPAKLLKENYFKGITSETLPQLYEELLSEKQFQFTYEDLLNSQFTDTDICKDVYLTSDEFNYYERYSKQNVIPSDRIKLGYKKYIDEETKNTLGFQFNVRPQDNRPFFKAYDKEKQLQQEGSLSKVFYETYLKNTIDITGLKRVETTVKNKTVLKRWYGIDEENTIENLLQLPESKLNDILQIGFTRNTHKNKMYRTKETGLSTSDYNLMLYIGATENKPLSILVEEMVTLMKQLGAHRNTITRNKNRLKKLFKDHHQNTNSNDKNLEIKTLQNAFDKIGLNEVS